MGVGPLILDLEGTALTAAECELLRQPLVGGVIFFARNIVDFAQTQALLRSVRDIRPELLLCVDQEGGRVQRCRQGFTRLPPMQVFHRLYAESPQEALSLAEDTGWLLAAEMLSVGFDFSFTPVLDVDDQFSSVIGDRSFSADAEWVCALAAAFIRGAHAAGMAVTGKHFPGHGSVREDSHKELPMDRRSFSAVSAWDMRPFQRLAPQLDAIMPAHIVFPEVDAEAVGFSSVWLQRILRTELHFSGVIFSDDLSMEGAAHIGGYPERARKALEAGCDMVLACNHRAGALAIIEALPADVYQDGEGRRSTMRARSAWRWDDLIRDARWQQTATRLQQLVDSLCA